MTEPATLTIVAISGSLREGSFNTALLRHAAATAPAGLTVSIAAIDALPHFSQDVERAGFPAAVAKLRRHMAAADGLLIATPEYNYSVPGVLKNAIDCSRHPDSPLDGKPTAILGAGGRSGTARAQRHLREIFEHNDVRVLAEPEVLIKGAWGHFDEDGRPDASTAQAVEDLVRALVENIVQTAEAAAARAS
jgi:chromate reductase